MDQMIIGFPEYVIFTTPNPTNLPLPSPDYLALHAACAKVAYLSGANEYINRILSDKEMKVLSEDGSSGHVLEDGLLQLLTSASA